MAAMQTQSFEYKAKPRIVVIGIHNLPGDALHAAAEIGDIELIREILANDPHAHNKPHSTQHTLPICWALQNQQTAAVKLLAECNLIADDFPLYHYLPLNFMNARWAERNPRLSAHLVARTRKLLDRAFDNIGLASLHELASILQNYLFVAEYSNADQLKSILQKIEIAFYKLVTSPIVTTEKTLFLVAFLLNFQDQSEIYNLLPEQHQKSVNSLIKKLQSRPCDIEQEFREKYNSAFHPLDSNCLDECLWMLCDFASCQHDLENLLEIDSFERPGEESQRAAIYLGIVKDLPHDEDYEAQLYYVEEPIQIIQGMPPHINIDLGNLFEEAGDCWALESLKKENNEIKFEDLKKLFLLARDLQSFVDYARSSNNKITMLKLLEAVIKDQSVKVRELIKKVKEADKYFNLADMNDSSLYFMETIIDRILWINGDLADDLKSLSDKYIKKSFIPVRLLTGTGLGLFDNFDDEDDIEKEEKKETRLNGLEEEPEFDDRRVKRVRY